VQFYKDNDGVSKDFASKYDTFVNEYGGVFRIGACDCENEADLCDKEKIFKFPTFRVYPAIPYPSFDVEGKVEIKNILRHASRYYYSKIIQINQSNIDALLNEDPGIPKVLLFTDKKDVPLLYKGLFVNFEVFLFYILLLKSKLHFGIVKSEE